MSDSVRHQRWQPTRLPRPWDSPGKNTGVGCHFLLQCMKVKSKSEVAQSCSTLSDPMDCSLPGSSIHGIFQARIQRGFSKLKLCTVLLENLGAAIFEKYLKAAFLALLALQETDDHILKLRNFSTALTHFSTALTHNEDVDQAAFRWLHMRVFQPGAETCVTAPGPHVMTYNHRGTGCQRTPDKKAAQDWSRELCAQGGQQQGCHPNLLVKAFLPPPPQRSFSAKY